MQRESITLSGANWDVPCLLYTPKAGKAEAAYLHIHGGGYVAGQMERSDPMNTLIASQLGITVLAVGYRLAPEHPVPAPLDDCYSALAWLHDEAERLGIDRERIAIGGESAGGGLAAALAIRARDAGDYAVCHQHLTYPMLDNLTGSESAPGDPLVGEFGMDSSEQCIRLVLLSRRSPTGGALCAGKSGQCRRSAFYMDVHCFFGPVS